jgi:hypothetical protein
MFLQGQTGPWIDGYSLDQKAITDIETLIRTPGSIDSSMNEMLFPLRRLEVFDNLLDVLDPVFGRDQNGVSGLYNHGILKTHPRDKTRPAVEVTVPAIHINDIAIGHIAKVIRLTHAPKSGP